MTDKIAKKMADSPGNPEHTGSHTSRAESDTAMGASAAGAGTISGGRTATSMGGGSTTGSRGIELTRVLDKAYEGKSLTDILSAPVSALHGLSDGDAQKLKDAFNIKTIRDLATNKYFLRAQGLHLLSESER
jgi:hypothetical protein